MPGKIHQHFASDHQRLDDLLERATSGQTIDTAAYHQFRAGLLKHIGMEEKILLPAAQLGGGKPLAVAAKLRLDQRRPGRIAGATADSAGHLGHPRHS
jgi:hypothetical protein